MTHPPRIEAGTTRLFSVQYSSTPNVAPTFAVLTNVVPVVVYSVTAVSGTLANQYQAGYTMPANSLGIYSYQWTVAFSAAVGSTDITRGLFQVIHTRPWTA